MWVVRGALMRLVVRRGVVVGAAGGRESSEIGRRWGASLVLLRIGV